MKKEDKKTSRASQTRSKTERPKVWTPPSSLDAPPAPDGFRHRWIRAESLGFQDSKNISGRLRSGYELVRADEYKDSDYPVVTEENTRGSLGLAAYCWLGYLKRSRSKELNIMQDSIRVRKKQLKTI